MSAEEAAAVPDPRFRDQPTRGDRAVAAGLVRRARAAMSDDERDTVVEAIAREIASERAAASAEVEARVQAALLAAADGAETGTWHDPITGPDVAAMLLARAAALASQEGQR